jgi:tricarballylate dehydrogenase
MGFVDFKGQVILACGGFEASARLRRQYLGEGWDMVVVRGTRFNTGTMLEKVIAAGAGSVGQWGGSCEFARTSARHGLGI